MPGRLIINADDFGLTPGINRAVLELFSAGVLTSATLMACGAAFDDAAAIARSHPKLGVGCHLVFVDGAPISAPGAVPSLLGADGRRFRTSLLDFAQAVLRGVVRPQELAQETRAQIERLQDAGVDVTHVDSHKHTHMLPAVAAPVLHAARLCGVHRVRNPFEPAWSLTLTAELGRGSRLRHLELRLLASLKPRFQQILAGETGLHTTDGTLGILATGSLDDQILERLVAAVASAAEDRVFELCTHVGHPDAALEQVKTRLRGSREVEYAALLNVLPDLLSRLNGPTLVDYRALMP